MQNAPSSDQLENLSRMTAILADNRKAEILARSLWEFFNFKLYCTIHDDDGLPNSHRIEGIDDPNKISDIRILFSIRRNNRQEEGLVHELLHPNLIPLGYPKFWIDEEQESDNWRLAAGIINNAEHIVMMPIYLSLGYAKDRFLGSSKLLTDREKCVIADLDQMAPDLAMPDSYTNAVSAYLQRYKINFKAIYVADAIVKARV